MLNEGTPTVAPPAMIVVAAALLDRAGRVLVQRRPEGRSHAGTWEFPGGKLEPGEGPAEALIRELREELGIAVAADEPVPLSFATEPRAGGGHLLLLLFAVRRWTGSPRALAADALRWVPVAEAEALAMPPPDVPLAAALRRAGVGA